MDANKKALLSKTSVDRSGEDSNGGVMPQNYSETVADLDALNSDANVLLFSEEAHRFESAFSAHAAAFRASKGRAQIAYEPAIQPDHARIKGSGDAVCALQVVGPN